MNALAITRATRVPLVVAVVLRALLWAFAATAAALLTLVLLDTLATLSVSARAAGRGAAVSSGIAVALWALWRDRRAFSLDHVALWIEERFPSLQYALVTQLELERNGSLARAASPLPNGARTGWARVPRAVAFAALAASVSWATLLALPRGAVARAHDPQPGDALARGGAGRDPANRLSPLVATVLPPAYSGLPRSAQEEPAMIAAIAGSEIVLEGPGSALGLSATLGDSALLVRGDGPWSLRVRLGTRPAIVRLADGEHRRVVALEPRADAAPVVTLLRPARDSVMRQGTGRIELSANVADDLGLAHAAFELIVSSGEGETFTSRSATSGATRVSGREAALTATLSLDSLKLAPGDIVHIRAVARDGNDVTGPGLGASETRTLRIARPGEYDSVAVEGAGPPEEQSAISQRMLILLAEALERRRPRLDRRTVLRESSGISRDQKRLRRGVSDIIFARLGQEPTGEHAHDDDEPAGALTPDELLKRAEEANRHASEDHPLDFAEGESPVVNVNRPLLEAYRAMWDASMELDQGDPGRALPHMRRALAAIQRARQAERVYLRGRPPVQVVDLARVRLTGRDAGTPLPRAPRRAELTRERLATRFGDALLLAERQPSSAVDSLLLLRVEALETAPRFAATLAELIAVLRRDRPAEIAPLAARARRELAGAPEVRASLSLWSVAP